MLNGKSVVNARVTWWRSYKEEMKAYGQTWSQVRDPIDMMLRECDAIHLSPAILEPEFRRLDPLNDNTDGTQNSSQYVGLDTMDSGESNKRNLSTFGPTENSVRIVLSGNSSSLTQSVKERPIWMSDSTISLNPTTGRW
ncbi:unnamed protein product [Trichobilharzia regenti]|nr:unnamed protein product [Trichobilharzia regenti]